MKPTKLVSVVHGELGVVVSAYRSNSDPLPSIRRVRVELSAHEWLIVEAVATRYKKPIGWVLQMALRSWIDSPLKKHD